MRSYVDADTDWRREPPAWPVEVLVHRDGEPDVWRSPFMKWNDADGPAPVPHAEHEVVDLARAEYQPHDWETLRALLDVLRKSARQGRESLARGVGDLVRAQHAPPPGRERYETIRAEVAAAAERFTLLDPARPWDAELWVPFARVGARLRALHLERDLDNGVPLPTLATQLWHYATGIIRAVPVYGPYAERPGPAAADLAAYQRVLALQPEYQARAQALHADPRLPPTMVGEGEERRANNEGYRAFRNERPDVWTEVADVLRAAFATLVDIETRLRLPKKPDPFHSVAATDSHAWPQSRVDAAKLLGAWVAVAERDAAWAAAPPPDRSEKIAHGQATLAAMDATSSALAELAAAVADAEARGTAFAWDDWGPRVGAVLAGGAPRAIGDRALKAWNEIRSSLAARAYASDPAASGLPAPVLAYCLARWRHEVQFELPCMGGEPHGYTELVEQEDDSNQLLLELPESRLFGWFWGDVDYLIFAIALDALRRGDFARTVAGVTNA
jgi:hypothetical protein